jgi:predicted 3-demethylubiquinone-9 3-methyltransferase (glyoxalase superfamily)
VVPTELIDMVTDADAAKAKRATEAMFKMKKIDIAAARRAYAG